MALFSSIKTFVDGAVLSAADLNNEFNNILNNSQASSQVGYSATVGQMQTVADPGAPGTESLAGSIADELARVRFKLKQIVGGAQWYSAPLRNLTSLISTADIADASITGAKLAPGLTFTLPPGVVFPYPAATFPTVPTGFLACNGQLVSRTTYVDLFAVIGTTYGVGDESTTFAVPDYRGAFLRGVNSTFGLDPGATTRTSHPYRTSWSLSVTFTNGAYIHTSPSTANVAVGQRITAGAFASGSSIVGAVLSATTFSTVDPASSSGLFAATMSGSTVGDNVGSYQQDAFGSHSHSYTAPSITNVGSNGNFAIGGAAAPNPYNIAPSSGASTGFAGSTETRPLNVYVNYIIKV